MFLTSFLPSHARAFWPFSADADAQVSATVPGSLTPTLQASVNIDPNPDKGLTDIQTSGDKALVAYGGPSGTIADVVSSAPPDRISVYVVRQGDTLSEIAKMFSVSVNTIIWANDLKGVADVHPGDTLIILPISGVEHRVVKGDTLKSIAKKYNADANEIAQYNGLDPRAPLDVDSTVIIPGGEVEAPVPATPKAVKNPSRGVAPEPYIGGSGNVQSGYYGNPLPGGLITQGIHGWNAVDIASPRGTPIYAAASGTVIIARSGGGWNGGYGNYVVITHENGTQTLYAHMSSVAASAGQSVSSGEIIGHVGRTGEATGPHLHFEVRGAANPFRNCAVGSVCSPQ
jgi:LysM repeat protein